MNRTNACDDDDDLHSHVLLEYHTKRSIAPRRAAAAATSPREPIHTLFNPISTVPGTTQFVLRYRHFRYLLMVVLRRGRKKERPSLSTQLTPSLTRSQSLKAHSFTHRPAISCNRTVHCPKGFLLVSVLLFYDCTVQQHPGKGDVYNACTL